MIRFVVTLVLLAALVGCKTAHKKAASSADRDDLDHPNRCKILIREKLIVMGEKKESKPFYEASIGPPFLGNGQLDPELAKLIQKRCAKLTSVGNVLISFDHDFVTEQENETFAITSNGTHQ